MNESLLVKLLGFPATPLHGDVAILDRWLWLKKRLPVTANGERPSISAAAAALFRSGPRFEVTKSWA
jgi:hypothetical protein